MHRVHSEYFGLMFKIWAQSEFGKYFNQLKRRSLYFPDVGQSCHFQIVTIWQKCSFSPWTLCKWWSGHLSVFDSVHHRPVTVLDDSYVQIVVLGETYAWVPVLLAAVACGGRTRRLKFRPPSFSSVQLAPATVCPNWSCRGVDRPARSHHVPVRDLGVLGKPVNGGSSCSRLRRPCGLHRRRSRPPLDELRWFSYSPWPDEQVC